MDIKNTTWTRGYSLDVEPLDQLKYFEICRQCGQAFDVRDWDQLKYHETSPGHQRIPTH